MGKDNEYKKVESDIFKFEKEGDCVEGKLISVEDNKSFQGKVYKIENDKGITHAVFSTVILASLMEQVSIGDSVKIIYTGVKPNPVKGQNDTKLYEVFVKKN